MEVRNSVSVNGQSFGMLIKPKAEEMKSFVEVVSGKTKIGWVRRGLRQIQKEQANNKYFDVVFTPEWNRGPAFRINPKFDSGVQSPLLKGRLYDNTTIYPNKMEKVIKEMEEIPTPSSILGQIILSAKYFGKFINAAVYSVCNPKEFLPAMLRNASDDAAKLASKIEKAEIMRKNKTSEIVNVFEK